MNRYDGAKFSAYKHEEGKNCSLVDNNVRAIFEDSKGHFLIGTQRGLQLYDPATELFKEIPILYQTGINMNAHISIIVERKNGDILIGTAGHGIYSLRLDEPEAVITENQLVPSFLSNIYSKIKLKIFGSLQKGKVYTVLISQEIHITTSPGRKMPGTSLPIYAKMRKDVFMPAA